ncbi:hypothetical protein ABMX86_22985 [Vibrio vulnificus]|uniref:hypothetical protein n=1 Tax=Vibrio vulnificus TaxID=672 RepID=UPI003ED9CC0E
MATEKKKEVTELCKETAYWLEEAGYLWARRKTVHENCNVTLSPKAFEALNVMPSSLKESKSIGNIMLDGAKETSKAGALAAVRVFLSEGAKLVAGNAI